MAILLGVALTLGLSACGGEPCFLTQQSEHLRADNTPERRPDGTQRYPKPFEVWIDDPELATDALGIVRRSGVTKLISHNQLQCSPRPVDGCTDCLTCTGLVRRTEYAYGVKPMICHYVGDAAIHIELGPGSTARAKALYTKR